MAKRNAENIETSIDDDCSICCEPLTVESRIAKIQCGHFMHTDCLIIYSKKENSKFCPLCRSTIINKTPSTESTTTSSTSTTTTTSTYIPTNTSQLFESMCNDYPMFRTIFSPTNINTQSINTQPINAQPTRSRNTRSNANRNNVNRNNVNRNNKNINLTAYMRREISEGKLDISDLPENVITNYMENYTTEELATITEFICENNNLISLKKLNNNKIINLPNLIKLRCGNNKLSTLDITTNKLHIISCSNNILSFNEYISELQNLNTLLCANNVITNLSNIIMSAPNLKQLNCSSNLLKNSIELNHKYLEDLDLSNNKITYISIKNLPKLKYIDYINNCLSEESASFLNIHLKYNIHKV
jgi:Leucine-rich repeat (LRR) protein